MKKKLCTRDYHDFFGKPYEDCPQCFVRDNPGQENPWLMTEEEYKNWMEKNVRPIKRITMDKPKEFWILETDDLFPDRFFSSLNEANKAAAFIKTKHHFPVITHVIEYSAYEKLKVAIIDYVDNDNFGKMNDAYNSFPSFGNPIKTEK